MPAPVTLYNRLRASRAKEPDVPPSFQRHAALVRHKLELKFIKSEPAVNHPVDEDPQRNPGRTGRLAE